MSRTPDRPWPPVTYWMKATAGVLLVLGLARVLLAVGDVLVLVLVSLVLAFGFQPALAWLEHRGLSRGVSVALGLLGGALLIGGFLWLVMPDVISEISGLVEAAPGYFRELAAESELVADLNERFQLGSKLQELPADLPSTVLGFIGSFTAFVFNSVTVLVLTIYFTVNLPRMRAGVAALFGRRDREDFEEIYDEAIQRVGGYVLGNLAVSLIAGVVSFIALSVIGVPFAAALAFVVALTDLIPTVGAIIGAALCTLVAAFAGLPEAIATGAFFLVYQQVENYVIQPRVMGRTIQMAAPVIILAVLIGGSLLGIIGALLAIPTAAIIKVAFRELYLEERLERVRSEKKARA